MGTGCEVMDDLEHGATLVGVGRGAIGKDGHGGRVAERIAGAGQIAGGDVPGGVSGERIAKRAFDGGIETIRDHANGDARAIVGSLDGGGHVERGDTLRSGLPM